MRRLTLYIFFMFLSGGFILFAQEDYKQVDSVTYKHFVNEDWEKLIEFGEKTTQNGADYFYFNLRMGIAYFKLEDYKSSLEFLTKANQNNSYNKIAVEYLFWSNYHLLKEKEAKEWYTQLDDSTQQRIAYTPNKKLSSIYLEYGLKLASDRQFANNATYLNLGLTHHLTGKIAFVQAYTFNSQSLNWGNYTQHQYYANPSYLFNKSTKLNLGLHGSLFDGVFDFLWEGTYQSPPPMGFPGASFIDTLADSSYQINGTYKELGLLIEPRFTKKWNNIITSGYFGFYTSKGQSNYLETYYDSTVITERTGPAIISQSIEVNDSTSQPVGATINQYTIGMDFSYSHWFITAGSDLKFILNDGNSNFFFSPYLKINISEKLQFSAYYFKKGNYAISLFEGSQLFNYFAPLTRYSLTTKYSISKKTHLYLTYQYESVFDNFNGVDYRLNSIYLGLKFKL